MPRYEIQPGDTLTSIAKKLGKTVSYLVERNNIKNPNFIKAYDYIYYDRRKLLNLSYFIFFK